NINIEEENKNGQIEEEIQKIKTENIQNMEDINNKIFHEELKFKGKSSPEIDPPNFSEFIKEKSQNYNGGINEEEDIFIKDESKEKETGENISSGLVYVDRNEFKGEICDACGKEMSNIKYICCICENTSLCDLCEVDHPHPCFKYKSKFLSNMEDTFYYLKTKHEIPPPQSTSKFLGKVFSNDLELSIEPLIDYDISLLTNKTLVIPFLIINQSKQDVLSDDFIILVKNFKKVKISYDEKFKFKVKGKNSINLDFQFTTNSPCEEKIFFEIYSHKFKIKDNKKKNCIINVKVSDDKEEEELNASLYVYGKIYLLKKSYKKLIVQVLKEKLSDKSPMEIYEILKAHQWNLDKAKRYLK
ncbi:MAG: hypothetical protein MJ252_07040, partial [archaeon]|nr:hypothetical protein [archaeon]